MIRSAASKVMWVGKATVFLVGLAVILALVFGVATSAMGANGDSFLLGKRNVATKVSTLVKRGVGPALRLQVGAGQPPMAVNSSAKVANLNSDRLDGKSEADFYAAGSKVSDSSHADQADSATNAQNADDAANADTVDGKHAADFYAQGSKVDDSSHADDADHADTADNATNAQNAANAASLGNVAASDYVRSNDPRLSNPTITFNVASNSNISWLIGNPSDYNSGSNVNPTLVLQRGLTYRFNVTVNGHPFRIASSASGPSYNVGVTNNDVMLGTVTFKVPMDAPSQLYYYCLAHPNMNGVINIQ